MAWIRIWHRTQPCHPRIHVWHAMAMPDADPKPSVDGPCQPRMAWIRVWHRTWPIEDYQRRWGFLISTDRDEVPASNTAEVLAEDWESPRSVVPDKCLITNLEQVPEEVEKFYGLSLCHSSGAHYVPQENLVTQVKQAVTGKSLVSRSFLNMQTRDSCAWRRLTARL